MYTYKALVGSLPATNKVKVVQLINQFSGDIIDLTDLDAYNYGVISQGQGMYLGVFLVKEHLEGKCKEFAVSHFALSPKHHSDDNGMNMIALLKEEMQAGDSIKIALPVHSSIKKDNLNMWGFERMQVCDTENLNHVYYKLVH